MSSVLMSIKLVNGLNVIGLRDNEKSDPLTLIRPVLAEIDNSNPDITQIRFAQVFEYEIFLEKAHFSNDAIVVTAAVSSEMVDQYNNYIQHLTQIAKQQRAMKAS